MLELNTKSKLKVKIDGEVYELDRITMGMAEAFEEAGKDKGSDTLRRSREFVCSLGLPEDVVKGLSVEDFALLFEHMMPKKK